jgi:hypothetical protein
MPCEYTSPIYKGSRMFLTEIKKSKKMWSRFTADMEKKKKKSGERRIITLFPHPSVTAKLSTVHKKKIPGQSSFSLGVPTCSPRKKESATRSLTLRFSFCFPRTG